MSGQRVIKFWTMVTVSLEKTYGNDILKAGSKAVGAVMSLCQATGKETFLTETETTTSFRTIEYNSM